MKFIELHVVRINDEIIDILRRFNYSVVASDSVNKKTVVNGLMIIPRITSDDLGKLKAAPRSYVKAYIVRSKEDVKNYPRIARLVNILLITREALIRLGPKSIERIYRSKLPVEICFKDLIASLKSPTFLRGLTYLMKYVVAGRVELVLTSCSEEAKDVLHPFMIYSVLEALGLTQVGIIKSLIHTPVKVLRGVGYSLNIE